MDAWIDTYHAVRRLTRQGTYVFLTDSAVGAEEEDNLRHLVTNLGTRRAARAHRPVPDVEAHARVLPVVRRARASERFSGAGRARRRQDGWAAAIGRARVAAARRCCDRTITRSRSADGPIRTATRSGRSTISSASDFHAEFYLTQIVSHHDVASVSRFLNAAERRGLSLPGVFGVFYYRSANPKTLQVAPELSASAGRGPVARVCGRRCARGRLRADDSHAARRRRPALLHQQPADRPRAERVEDDTRQGGNLS